MGRFRARGPRAEPGGEGRPFQQGRVERDPEVRDQLELAERLGISYKRLSGWEPRTLYEYDESGRIISSRPEPEWDEVEVGWMLALQAWRDSLCSSCGWPRSVCQDPMTEFMLQVPPPTRCHVTTAVDKAQKAYSDQPGARLGGLLWRAQIRGDESPATGR